MVPSARTTSRVDQIWSQIEKLIFWKIESASWGGPRVCSLILGSWNEVLTESPPRLLGAQDQGRTWPIWRFNDTQPSLAQVHHPLWNSCLAMNCAVMCISIVIKVRPQPNSSPNIQFVWWGILAILVKHPDLIIWSIGQHLGIFWAWKHTAKAS